MSAQRTKTSRSIRSAMTRTGTSARSNYSNCAIPDDLVFCPGVTNAQMSPAETKVTKILANIILRTMYDTDCFYPTTQNVLDLITVMMPLAIKYAGISSAEALAWDMVTIPIPPAVKNGCIKRIKYHQRDVQREVSQIITGFCMHSFDEDTKGAISMIYLRSISHRNALYNRVIGGDKVLMDIEGNPSVACHDMEHMAIYHDLVGIHSQYSSSTTINGPSSYWFSGTVVQETTKFIRGLLDKAVKAMAEHAAGLSISKDSLRQDEADIRKTTAFIAFANQRGAAANICYEDWSNYGNAGFVAHCMEIISTVISYKFANGRLTCPTHIDRENLFIRLVSVLNYMPTPLYLHHQDIIGGCRGNGRPTHPVVPVVVYESTTLFTPIPILVAEDLQQMRDRLPVLGQVASLLETDDMARAGGSAMGPLQVNHPEPIPAGSESVTVDALVDITSSPHVAHTAHWSLIFTRAGPMGMKTYIESKLRKQIKPELRLAVVNYYETLTDDALQALLLHLDELCPYVAGIYEPISQDWNLHMDLVVRR